MPAVHCPECGAVQNPREGDLSLTCGSILSEFGCAADPQSLNYQSDKCKIAMLTRQRQEWREMARCLVIVIETMQGTPEVLRRARIVLADYKIMKSKYQQGDSNGGTPQAGT